VSVGVRLHVNADDPAARKVAAPHAQRIALLDAELEQPHTPPPANA
jgi:hypothetical protein